VTTSIEPFLRALVECGGSDLHCKVGSPPRVRIEDDVAVTDGAPTVLSDSLPRDPDEVLAWMREVQATPAVP
jgi:Tfp pilus assembly pilus retraction ATPase PilT